MAESGKRMEQLKSYLRRLSEGEILDSVRADFMREFKDVDAVAVSYTHLTLPTIYSV